MIATTDGAVDVTVDIQSPIWAEFDRVEFYVNTTTTKIVDQQAVRRRPDHASSATRITPDVVQTAPGDFTVVPVVVVPERPGRQPPRGDHHAQPDRPHRGRLGRRHGEGDRRRLAAALPGAAEQPEARPTNTTLADLTDGNLGEDGITALAFTNPIFVDVDGGGWTAPGVQVSNP